NGLGGRQAPTGGQGEDPARSAVRVVGSRTYRLEGCADAGPGWEETGAVRSPDPAGKPSATAKGRSSVDHSQYQQQDLDSRAPPGIRVSSRRCGCDESPRNPSPDRGRPGGWL